MSEHPGNPFRWERAHVAHIIADELRDGWHGDYGVSFDSLVEHFGDHRNPEAAVWAALPHVERAFREQGFVLELSDTIPHEYRLRKARKGE